MRLTRLVGSLVLLAMSACLENDSGPPLDGDESSDVVADHGTLAVKQQSLETALCGNMSGLQANAPWPMYGGCPTHAAQSSQYGPTANGKNWQRGLAGKVSSSPAIAADGSIYVGSEGNWFFKINPSTGAIIKQDPMWGKVKSSPAIGADGTVYVGDDSGTFYGYDPTTLKPKWTVSWIGAVNSSPAVAPDGTIYFGSDDFNLYAHRPDGTRKWSHLTGFPVSSSPAIGTDGTVFFGSDITLYALNPSDGTKKWSRIIGFPITSSPAVGRFGRVYIGAGDKLLAYDASNGTPLWEKSLGSCTIYAPAIGQNGTIYVGVGFNPATGGSLYAVSPDGDILWHFDVLGGVKSTPVIDRAGNIYFGANDNYVYAVDGTGAQIWKFSTGDDVRSSPALTANGAVIVGSDDNNLYSIGVGATRVANGAACTSDAQCVPGSVCGIGNGPRFGLASGTRACWVPSCENKVQDPGETEVDCGGSCGSCTNVCSLACKQGDQVSPPALEVLPFSKASFVRPSVGTYQLGAQKLELAGGNVLRFEERGDGKGRLALFEGARTNRLRYSEYLTHTPEWRMPSGGTPIVATENYAVSPKGDTTAERMVAPAGGNPSRTQTISGAQAAGVLSGWLRLRDVAAAESSTRAVLADSLNRWFSSPTAWPVTAAWTRRSMLTTASPGSADLSFSHKSGWPGNAATFPQLGAADFLVWGMQWEEGAFASSYIPSTDASATRATDRLIFEAADVPAWVRTGLWQIDVAPTFAHTDIAIGSEMTLVAWENGGLTLGRDGVGGVLKITSASASTSLSIDWAKDTKLTVTLDFGAHTLAVRGATRGDGTIGTGTLAIPAGRIGVGSALDGTKAAFARISELRRVTSASRACVSDPDCVVCGDGFVSGNEVCDKGADPGCKPDCTGPITNASTELSCVDRADNDSDGLIDCADVVDCGWNVACRVNEGIACTLDRACKSGLVCAGGACRRPQCANGVVDPGETGRDCGGPCAPCGGNQCKNACRVGEATAPAALDAVDVSSGTFTRASFATFVGPTGEVESLPPNELRWVTIQGARLGLFEGAGNNLYTWSSGLDKTPSWTPSSTAPMSLASDAATAPDRTLTAEALSAPQGPARSPIQTTSFPAVGTTSLWLKTPAESEDGARDLRATVTAANVDPLLVASWPLDTAWQRLSARVEASGSQLASFGVSQTPDWPVAGLPALSTDPFYAWGAQLELGRFPTSYMPSEAASGARAPDTLTFANPPAWLQSATWQFEVSPLYASDELLPRPKYVLVALGSSAEISLVPDGATKARLEVKHPGGTTASAPFTFRRGAFLRITIDPVADRVRVEGTSLDSDTFTVAGLSFPSGVLRVGGSVAGGNEAFAAISMPRRVSASETTCQADAACSCGNGIREPHEQCDPALTPNCNADCSSTELTVCEEDADCGSGAVCGAENGISLGGTPRQRFCWPTLCATQASAHCGPGQPCGACSCIPNCANAPCGEWVPDGCGGTCRPQCGSGQAGCTNDDQCAEGQRCGEGVGALFGLAQDANVCWDARCEDPILRAENCGTASSACGACATQEPNCQDRTCGTDPAGNDCGTCTDGLTCDVGGHCVLEAAYLFPAPPIPATEAALENPSADPAGALKGIFSVDANGAANYSIPIDAPPGRAGLTPQLSLQYVSTSQDGYVGLGWSLGGLSGIARCPRTYATHGYAAGIGMEKKDALCLDGKLLVEVAPNEFRTELDIFVRVRAYGEQSVQVGDIEFPKDYYTGYEYFEVWTKDGKKMTYGRTEDARIEAAFDRADVTKGDTNKDYPVRVSWLLNEIVDPYENKIEIRYERFQWEQEDMTYTGEIRPTFVFYGPDRANVLAFEYKTQDLGWAVRYYRGGVGRHFSSPLTTISASIDGVRVRRYRLESELKGDEWMLKSVTACADGDAGERCMPATRFDYLPASQKLSLLAKTTDDAARIPTFPDYPGIGNVHFEPDNVNNWQVAPIDVHGDGRQDLMQSQFEYRGHHRCKGCGGAEEFEVDQPWMYLRTSYGELSRPSNNIWAFTGLSGTKRQCPLHTALDFEGDGKQDYFAYCTEGRSSNPTTPSFVRYTPNAPGLFTTTKLTDMLGQGPRGLRVIGAPAVADFNGDSIADVIVRYQDFEDANFVRLYRGTGTGLEPEGPVLGLPDKTSWIADFTCSGNGFFCFLAQVHTPLVMDRDGDGVSEVLLLDSSQKPNQFLSLAWRRDRLSLEAAGTYYGAPVEEWDEINDVLDPGRAKALFTRTFVMDANGDGLSDVVVAKHESNEVRGELYLSTGSRFVFAGRSPGLIHNNDGTNTDFWNKGFVVDTDSDGRDELLIPSQEDGWTIHTPYSHTRSEGRAWTTRRAEMPFTWAFLKYKTRSGKKFEKERFGFQGPVALDWDGDGVSEIVTRATPDSDPDDINHPVFEIWKAAPRTQRLMNRITDGLGKRIDVVYDSGKARTEGLPTQGYVFGGMNRCQYPQRCVPVLRDPIVVEHAVTANAGDYSASRGQPTIKVSYAYKYEDAREDMRGRGWLGFRRREVREYTDAGRIVSQTNVDYDLEHESTDTPMMYPFAGYPRKVETITTSGTQTPIIIEGLDPAVTHRTVTINTWATQLSSANVPFVVLDLRQEQKLESLEGGTPRDAGLTQDSFEYDGYGNRIANVRQAADGAITIAVVGYANAADTGPGAPNWEEVEGKWLVGLPRVVLQMNVKTRPALPNVGYRLDLSYSGNHGGRGRPTRIERYGLLDAETTALRQTIDLDYDDFGNEKLRTLSGPDSVTQVFGTKFDDRGMFPTELSNAAHPNDPIKVRVDARNGMNRWLSNPDGSWFVVNRDGFGRTVGTVDATGHRETTHYIAGGTSGGALRVRVSGTGMPTTETEYNQYGLPIEDRRTETVAGVTRTSIQERAYDSRGALFAQGAPHWSSTPAPDLPQYLVTHDNLNRVVMESRLRIDPETDQPYFATRHHTYWTAAAVPPGEEDSGNVPPGGSAHRVSDVGQASTALTISDTHGVPVHVVDAHGVTSTFSYDSMNHLYEANVGGVVTRSLSDETGRVTYMLDPSIGAFQFVYNGLGLLRKRTRNGVETNIDYDALGRRIGATTPDGTYTWTYDGDGSDKTLVGHLVSEKLSSSAIGTSTTTYAYGNPGARASSITREIEGETLVTRVENDGVGRPWKVHYPATTPYFVEYHYEANEGRLDEVREGGTTRALWKLDETDAYGNATRVSHDNGLRLARDYHALTGQFHSSETRSQGGTLLVQHSVGYQYQGLVSTRSTKLENDPAVVESFGYDALGRLTSHTESNQTAIYSYDDIGNLRDTPEKTLQYDAAGPYQASGSTLGDHYEYVDGNQTYRSGPSVTGGEQRIQYTAFNLPRSVESGGSTTLLRYDASGSRAAVLEPSGERRIYAGELYTRISTTGQPTAENLRISTPDGFSIEAQPTAQGAQYRYMQTDHLGSTVAVVNAGQAVTERRKYAPFGGMTATGSAQSRWGFTGHEHDREWGLINMQGRMYDPQLRRFLSPDPFVQSVTNAQSWNAYSYVGNSPLSATDPTGFIQQSGPSYEEQAAGMATAAVAEAAQPPVTTIEFEEGSVVQATPSPASVADAKPAPQVNESAATPAPRLITPAPATMESDSLLTNAVAFGEGVVKGAATTAGLSFGIGYGAGAAAAALEGLGLVATAATAAPVLATAGTAALVAWGIYALASGGGEAMVNSITRVATGQGSASDWHVAGTVFGGGVAGLRAGAMTQAGMEAAAADFASTEVMGIVAGGGPPTGNQATYEIIDGVRRAKAAELSGKSSIPAEVIVDNKVVARMEVPLDSLRSPNKSAIDYTSSPAAARRFDNVMQATRDGDALPPISIQPGSRGVPISDVFFE